MSLRRRTQVIAPAAAYWLHRVLDDLERGGEVQGVRGRSLDYTFAVVISGTCLCV